MNAQQLSDLDGFVLRSCSDHLVGLENRACLILTGQTPQDQSRTHCCTRRNITSSQCLNLYAVAPQQLIFFELEAISETSRFRFHQISKVRSKMCRAHDFSHTGTGTGTAVILVGSVCEPCYRLSTHSAFESSRTLVKEASRQRLSISK